MSLPAEKSPPEPGCAHLVDDDDLFRASLAGMLRDAGVCVVEHRSGEAFLDASDLAAGCVLLDIQMPGVDGLSVLRELERRRVRWPVVVLTASGQIAVAVTAMKLGAIDFLQKPVEREALLASVAAAERLWAQREAGALKAEEAVRAVAVLSPRERQVLGGLLDGLPNKIIAHELGISVRTVDVHRARLMDKLGVRSLSAALRLAIAAGVEPLTRSAS